MTNIELFPIEVKKFILNYEKKIEGEFVMCLESNNSLVFLDKDSNQVFVEIFYCENQQCPNFMKIVTDYDKLNCSHKENKMILYCTLCERDTEHMVLLECICNNSDGEGYTYDDEFGSCEFCMNTPAICSECNKASRIECSVS